MLSEDTEIYFELRDTKFIKQIIEPTNTQALYYQPFSIDYTILKFPNSLSICIKRIRTRFGAFTWPFKCWYNISWNFCSSVGLGPCIYTGFVGLYYLDLSLLMCRIYKIGCRPKLTHYFHSNRRKNDFMIGVTQISVAAKQVNPLSFVSLIISDDTF